MNKVLLLKRAVCSSALMSLAACGGSGGSSSSSVASSVENTPSSSAVSSVAESSSEAASSVTVVSSVAESSSSMDISSSSMMVVMSSVASSSSSMAVSSMADASSAKTSSSEEASSSSEAATANLLPDASFESGALNSDYWQTNAAKISTDAESVTDGTSGVDMSPTGDGQATRSYIEITLPADELNSGDQYFVSADARASASGEWQNWDVELFEGVNRVEFRTFNQLGINTLGTSGDWYERAVTFPIPASTIGRETRLRITSVGKASGKTDDVTSAIDNVNMQKIDTYLAKYDFEDGDVSDFSVSDGSTLTTNTTTPVSGSTSLSFTPAAAPKIYIDLNLEKGTIQSGKRYVITMGFGMGSIPTNPEFPGDKPFLVHFVDTVSGNNIGGAGQGTYNYAYFAGGEGSKLSAAFIIDVDRDQSADVDWGASDNIVLRASDLWGSGGFELLLDDLTISEIKE